MRNKKHKDINNNLKVTSSIIPAMHIDTAQPHNTNLNRLYYIDLFINFIKSTSETINETLR